MFKEVETRVVTPSKDQLMAFTIRELRDYARELGVKTSTKKEVTVRNLLESGRATILAQLGD